MERHTQSLWEGTDAFTLPENRKTVKKVNQSFLSRWCGKAKKRPQKLYQKSGCLGLFISNERKDKVISNGKNYEQM